MRKFWLFLISLLIGIGLFIWIGRTVGWQEIKKAFLVFTGWQGIVIFVLTLLIMIIRNWTWKEILKGKNVRISFFELFKIYLAAFSLRFLAPIFTLSDEILQTLAIKEKNSIPISKGASSVILERILELTINFLLIFFGILFFLFKIGLPPENLAIILGSIFLFLLVGISFFYFKVFKRESLAKTFFRVFNHRIDSEPLEIEKEIFDFFKFKKISTWQIFGLSFLRAIITYLRSWFLIIFLGKYIGPLPALSILSFSFLAMMIPIPTALGSHEAVQTFVFNSLGLGLPLATAFTMIIRGVELLVALAGVIFLFRLGISLFKNTLFKKYEI